ncbi:flotillin domain-containing protein, partial [Leisingera sp. ANG-Vp]|uniref:flotillin domain-containing protein n=1 Tax=Leisingera sp. ANG-Vp TaxID=1577896 RepID=UPI00057ECF87
SAGAGNGAEKPVVNQALDSIMGMAVQMPALKKLGEELGLSMENGVSGVASQALGVEAEDSGADEVPLLNGAVGEGSAPEASEAAKD